MAIRRRPRLSQRSRLRVVLGVLVVFALALPGSSFGTGDIPEVHKKAKAKVDKRSAHEPPSAAQRGGVERLSARGRWNRFGTPSSLINDGGFLATDVAGSDAAAAARAFVRENKGLFKLENADVLHVAGDARLSGSNGHAVVFRQRAGGLPVSPDGVVTVAVEGSSESGWDVAYASSTLPGDVALAGSPALSLAEGWSKAAAAVGIDGGDVTELREAAGWTILEVDGLAQEQSARLVAFPVDGASAVPAWETTVLDDEAESGYWQFVDARTGEVLFRESIVDQSADNPKWKVFPASPHSALDSYPWNYPSADVRELWCWLPDPACQYLPSTSRGDNDTEWDENARTNTPTFTTTGNNANDSEAWFSSFGPGPTSYRPTSPTRDYVYPWENVWFETRCDPANFATPGVGNDISAAVTNLFEGHNRMHDWTYVLGFDEARWNGQDYNFGRNPAGENDPVLGQAQAGGANGGYPTYTGRDNANMSTRPDGQSSITNMYLWQPLAGSFYAPCVDGDFDQSVIGHEFGHMVENRMIGKGNRRMGSHAGMMGESHGDLLAMEYVNEYNFAPTGGSDNPQADAATTLVGRYVTGNNDRGIRNYDMAFSTGTEFPQPGRYPTTNPLNFSDVGYDITGPQVHADGEIWSATNFDLRELLLDRYPSHGQSIQRDCADGIRPVQDCPGNRRWIQLLFDAFQLMPVRPSFLDARDAILAADAMRFGGANQDLLWLGFARRGFGQNADDTDADDVNPRADFESPMHEEATVVFNAFALNEGNAPIANARLYVGHYERGVTPIADTNPATPGPYLDNTASFVPDDGPRQGSRHRAYDFVVNAEGYGHVRFRLTELKPGETRVVNVYMPTNWASRHKGAVASGDGARHDELIDDTEGTNWESTGAPVEGRQVVVQLAGGSKRVDNVKVSALLQPGQNRFTALREFEVLGCTVASGGSGNVTIGGTSYSCRTIVRSQSDAFPGASPRPVAPEMILRTWNAGGGQGVTHVVFRVLNNQCTGSSEFHGEQDNDPANTSTDCRIGTLPPLPPRNTEVRTSELQVFSDKPRVDGAQAVE
jgi:extracellular elastinolytic metalloproteinase